MRNGRQANAKLVGVNRAFDRRHRVIIIAFDCLSLIDGHEEHSSVVEESHLLVSAAIDAVQRIRTGFRLRHLQQGTCTTDVLQRTHFNCL